MKKAVFLFDYTGIMAKPWAESGYLCYCFDAQHPNGISQKGNIITVGIWLDDDFSKIEDITGSDVDFVFGFPECTDLAVSGAAHFARKRAKNPNFQKEAMDLVRLVERVGEHFDCPWGLENPISVISTMWRKPNYIFQPYEYGGYLPEDDVHPIYPDYIKPRDAYPKKTCIWSGNGFVMPEPKKVPVLPGYSDQHKKLGGKSIKTKNIRSATPRGFAIAVFQANKQT